MRVSLNTYLTDPDDFSFDQVKSKIILAARRHIAFAPARAAEIALNRYLIKEFKSSLKKICLDIIYNCNISMTKNRELTITFKTDKINQMAELITFGTGKVPGSKILIDAFKILRKQ